MSIKFFSSERTEKLHLVFLHCLRIGKGFFLFSLLFCYLLAYSSLAILAPRLNNRFERPSKCHVLLCLLIEFGYTASRMASEDPLHQGANILDLDNHEWAPGFAPAAGLLSAQAQPIQNNLRCMELEADHILDLTFTLSTLEYLTVQGLLCLTTRLESIVLFLMLMRDKCYLTLLYSTRTFGTNLLTLALQLRITCDSFPARQSNPKFMVGRLI